ncbi:MAG TPA: peptidylprolyl isomerase, partial [Thermoanaerobaculia bacterium]|nr:peptidylprolyl isomerase [Thermoanaerobaculia bacterium]
MKRTLLGIVALAALVPTVRAEEAPTVMRKQILSRTYTIDKKYRSMEGPGSLQRVYLGDQEKPELLWIVGVHTEMVGADGKTPQLPELMCHVNIDLDPARHQALFNLQRATGSRLVTLSQGMLDASLPPGFGFPIASNEPLILFTQVLNHNIADPKNIKVRHRVTFEYIRDRDLKTPIKPLFNVGASGMVLLNNNPLALTTSMATPAPDLSAITVDSKGGATSSSVDEHSAHGTSCLIAPRAPNATGSAADYVDPEGRHLTGHWVVPPGRQVNHSDITWFMSLPYDTRLHYAAVHLHPFAKALIIKDVTTGKNVFESKARGPKEGIGLAHVDTFVSPEGVPLYKDHKYELISDYDNPTKENSDSMASAFLGLQDPEFVKPDSATLTARAAELLVNAPNLAVVVRTSVGDFGVELLRNEAPDTVKQFLRLARGGVFDHVRIARVNKDTIELFNGAPTAAQRALMKPIAVERLVPHQSGTLSLCPGDNAFAIVYGNAAADRDGRCSAFARIGPGADVIRAIAGAPRDENGMPTPGIEVTKVDIYEGSSTPQFQLAPAKSVAAR